MDNFTKNPHFIWWRMIHVCHGGQDRARYCKYTQEYTYIVFWFAALCAKPVPNRDHLLVWTAVWILPRRLRWPVGEVSTLWLGLAPDLPNTKHLLRSIRLATYSYCDHIGKTRYCCWPFASVHKSSSAPKIPGNQLPNPYFTKTLNPQHNFGRARCEVYAC